MKRLTESYLWSCDFKNCNAKATSTDASDAPSGWTSFVGAVQNASGGGPATFDLCSKHSASFERTYKVHRDIDEELFQEELR